MSTSRSNCWNREHRLTILSEVDFTGPPTFRGSSDTEEKIGQRTELTEQKSV